jgi:predicted 3-demethylubiquinone-9 3-methyltransferase (glyoxalase superfamily)
MEKIVTYLWFDDQAEEAANFYTSVFKDSKVLGMTHYPEAATEVSGKPAGSVLTVDFEIQGQRFVALNGGPEFKFSEAVSFQIECEDQQEVDYFWDALTDGGEESACGWLKDRFGVSWQVTPKALAKMISDPNPAKVNAAVAAFLPMRKLDLDTIQKAFDEAA